MKNKLFLLVLLFFVCILSISAISAAENTTNKDVISTDNNLETSIYDDVSTSKENFELNLEQNDNDELKFTDLNTTINGNSESDKSERLLSLPLLRTERVAFTTIRLKHTL